MAIIDFLWTNKEWLFSGAGATALLLLSAIAKWIGTIQRRRKRIADARRRQEIELEMATKHAAKPVDLSVLDDFQIVSPSHDRATLRACDFCRKSEHSVKTLFTRSGSYICEDCLDGGVEVLDRKTVDPTVVQDIAEITHQLTNPGLEAALRRTYEGKLHELAAQVRKRRRERPGDVVAGGQLIRPIGAGNFATVWEARSLGRTTSPSRTVAVKIFDQDKIAMGLMLWRFHRGIRAMRLFADLGKRTPPSIVRLYEISQDNLSFSMEYLPGGDLQSLPSKRWTLKHRLSMFARIADAVAFAHANGIIHRDIKPANIVLDEQGAPVLTDFDIADLAFATTQSVYAGGLGTPLFAAPEQLTSTGSAAHPTCDIYSLGKLLYYFVVEAPPPIGSTESGHIPGYIKKIPITIIQNAIAQAIRHDPTERPQSVKELVNQLGLPSPPPYSPPDHVRRII